MSPPDGQPAERARAELAPSSDAGRDVNSRTGCDAYASIRSTPNRAEPPASVADYTAGYEAGYTAGYRAAMTVLDDAGAFLATTLQPSTALDVAHARRHIASPADSDRWSARDVAERRRRTYASWGLTPPDDPTSAGRAPSRRTGDVPMTATSPPPGVIASNGFDAYASMTQPARRPLPARNPGGRRRWPLLLIGASAGTATWTGWVGLGELTGFGVIHPLPGIWDTLTINTAITLPVGVEAYAVYALSVATDPRPLTTAAQRWAWGSAAGALLLGMGGQIAFHLLDSRAVTTAPWWVIALVSSLPVLVLGAASLLWHLAAITPPAEIEAVAASRSAVVDVGRRPPPPAATSSAAVASARATSARATSARATSAPVATGPATSAPVASAPLASAGRPLARPAAATAPRTPPITEAGTEGGSTGVTEAVTEPGSTLSDAEILAAIVGEPPSMRALMRDYGIGQTRAVRIRRAATRTQRARQSTRTREPTTTRPAPSTTTDRIQQ